MNKANVIATLNSLPEVFKTEELIEKLLFIEKVEQANQPALSQPATSEVKPSAFSFSLN